ncbi:hypothetical protein [Yersinia canariae]|uniref:hypothetical protein n=1 Tax=Yersinia canariae TaxID=2607663 RepID=UPI0011A0A88A|nr:hypothetical protein [Yersinia canariae]
MDVTLISIVILALQIVLFLLVIFCKSFVKGWVEGSISKHYQEAAEKRSHEQQVRLKAELVAELMAEWVSAGADRKKLRELTNKAFLWLPKDIAKELSELMGDSSTLRVVDVLVKVRDHLQDNPEDKNFDPDEVIYFPLTEHEQQVRKDNDVK